MLPGLERALTWAGEPWKGQRARMPAPKGTLGTLVNGPEGLPLFDGDAWEQVDWWHHEEQVRRLRGRIFQAVREGDWPRARSLQRLALRSWSNTLVSVRQVTQRNAGRRTAGIDGLVALTSQARAEMAVACTPASARTGHPRSGGCTHRKPVTRQKCGPSGYRTDQ